MLKFIYLFPLRKSGHSAYTLYKRWNIFKNNKNRRTAINLGYSVRITTYIVFYTLMTATYFVCNILVFVYETDEYVDKSIRISDFTTALS